MHIITDYIAAVSLLYFFYSGWRKGFFRTLLGPISLIAGCLMAFIYYQKNHNIVASMGICILGPFIIHFLISIVLKIWHKAVNDDAPLSFISRLFGGSFSVLWGGTYLAMMLILIGMVPIHVGWFEKAQKDVLASKSYTFINTLVNEKIPIAIPDIKKIASTFEDPAKLKALENTEELEALRADDRLQDLFSDEETAEQIKNKNYGKLLVNPKMQEVFQNEELLKKIFALNKRIMEENPVEGPGPKTLEVQPK